MGLDPLDVARLFAGAATLGFAAYTDWRWRRAPNLLWWLLGAVGAVLLLLQVARDPTLLHTGAPNLVVSLVFAGMVLVFYRFGLLAGGADAKALVALAILLPFPLHLGAFPLRSTLVPPAFGVLGNALLAFLAVPVGLTLLNLARRDLRWPHMLLGLRMPLARARAAHVWPLEYVQDGEVRTMLMPSRFLWEDEDWDALAAAGCDPVWVTPKVPFLVPLLLGFVTLFFLGDVLSAWVVGLGAGF